MNLSSIVCLALGLLTLGILQPAKAVPPPVAPLSPAPLALRFSLQGQIVTAAVERGVQQVVLERRCNDGWKPISVAYPTARTGRATFKLASSLPAAELRVQGYRSIKFPARFLRGKRSFERPVLESSLQNILASTGAVVALNTTANLRLTTTTGSLVTNDMTALANTAAGAPSPDEAEVVESDIWEIVGDQVYFFNQYRGLQILDLADPTLPVRTGSLRLPASGEQMIVLDKAGSEVALLGHSNEKSHAGKAMLWLVRVTEGSPVITSQVPLGGTLTDSRLVGTTLHVLSRDAQAAASLSMGGDALLTSIELSDLDAPKILGTLRVPATSAVLQAAAGHLLLATTGGTANAINAQHSVHLISINGTPQVIKTFVTRGEVQDKFKLGIVNDAVAVVSQERTSGLSKTWVQTFPVQSRNTGALAELELEGARGEVLHASRFDSERLYVVTFRQIDPLFIVDLADPSAPVLSGVLEVPGWSTYLEPLGDRLLAVGVEDWRVTVSLFDVSDVSAPALLSRLRVGSSSSSSWSEATYDEKAVAFLPEEGLVMVPFEDNANTGYRKAVQVVHLEGDELTAGPVIEHLTDPRRGSFISGHYVTISGQDLQVHDTTASTPIVQMPLAWRTDLVVQIGDYLVQIEDGSQLPYVTGSPLRLSTSLYSINQGVGASKLRITSTTDPDALEQVIDLGAGQIVGLTRRGDRLYLAQWLPPVPSHSLPSYTLNRAAGSLRTLALDLSATPPVVTEAGRVTHDLTAAMDYGFRLNAAQALWVNDEKLVWYLPVSGMAYRPILWNPLPVIIGQPILTIDQPVSVTLPAQSLTLNSSIAAPAAAASLAAVLCPVDVGESGITASPALVVQVNAPAQNISQAFVEKGHLFFSYDLPVKKPSTTASIANTRLVKPSVIPYRPSPAFVASWLQVIDWSSETPVLRDPVSIPGPLLSVAQADAQGAVILTQSDQQITKSGPATRVVQACAYDGVSAWQLDSYITSTPYHSTTATDGTRLYLGREVGVTGVVGLGYNATTGRLSQINTWPTAEVPTQLNVLSGHLLASSYGNLEVATISASTGALKPVASYDTPVNLCLPVNRAVFTSALDLWIPAAEYGVELLQRAALAP